MPYFAAPLASTSVHYDKHRGITPQSERGHAGVWTNSRLFLDCDRKPRPLLPFALALHVLAQLHVPTLLGLLRDPVQAKSRGFGYVRFVLRDDAETALKDGLGKTESPKKLQKPKSQAQKRARSNPGGLEESEESAAKKKNNPFSHVKKDPFSQNKAVSLEWDLSHSAGAEEIEAIKSPSCDIRIQANPNYPPRSCSVCAPPGVHNSTHELCRSSSSPNLNLPNTFLQRLSAESIRKNATANLTASPKRSHAPPPIKVPKLRSSSLAMAVGSNSSPVGTRSSASFQHGHSRSDGGNHFVSLRLLPTPKPFALQHCHEPGKRHTGVAGDGHNAIETTGELSSFSHLVAIRPYESSDLSSLRSVISNGSSAEEYRSMNRIFTPASTPIFNRSTGFPLAQPSHKPPTPCYSARDGTSRSLSVDDFDLNINSNALLDLLRRDGKKIPPRPQSMSDCGLNRYAIFTEVFGRSINSIYNSPRTAMYSLPLVNHQFPQSTRWNTTSIAQMICKSTTSELDKLVTEALKTYPPDSHRFVTGDIKELVREGRQAEQKAEDLHRRYLTNLHA
ncbi:hypothetical protein PCASD_13382 [Puccinia coronata f. sp. avenae]|uniref:Uncharacterized protein n=1 Tax=Puccinia coronata f. sp. avenae TaxID=200324 RepID=A0A2N5TZB9_9BASI|nr:hypothetical protein PCASD_13382 [Puccinia coronata f. sp. avenae]